MYTYGKIRFKELAQVIMGTIRLKTHRTGWQAGDAGEASVAEESEVTCWQNFLLLRRCQSFAYLGLQLIG